MESQHQKWVNLSYLALSALFGYIVFSLSGKVTGAYDLEARVRNIDLILRAVALVGGLGLFFVLYRSERANQFMNEVAVELSRVTWPSQRDTVNSTFVVIIMVIISGIVLGFLDYCWIQLLKWVL